MATDKRTYPIDYFAWYNDDDRLAILTQDTTSTSGERTREKYDTFQGSGSSGSITAFTNYHSTVSGTVRATDADHGLSTGDSITVTGATTSAHNITATVTKIDKDSFYYTATFGADSTASWTATNVLSGIRITFHSKYEELTAVTDNLQSGAGLDSALHNAVLCYVKSRLLEDIGDLQKAQYFITMYESKIKKHRGRRSGIRLLSVPRL